MALVPNGRHRVMREQKFSQNIIGQQDAQPNAELSPRMSIDQEQIGGNQAVTQPDASIAPENPPTPNMADQQAEPVDTLGDDVPQEEKVEKPHEESGGESEIRDAWYSMLTELGVPPRTIDNLEKKLYSEETDLASNTIKGHYMIPTYTQGGKVSKEQALNLARKMEQTFGLTSRMRLENRNWRIDFQTQQKAEIQEGGSSFDSLSGESKAAMTMGEMLMARRNELFETMRAISEKKGK